MALGTATGSSFFGHCYDVFVNGQYLFNTCGLPPPPPVPLPETPDLGGTGVGTGTGTGTGAEVEDKSTADTATDTCTAGCPNCPPQAGVPKPFAVNGKLTGLKGAAYQFRVNTMYGIAGQFPYTGGTIVEWV
ncbi:hypothetical protein FHY55_10575 [Oceanicola sp. D3]|uniref:hypothetical protein n=1 Tax=Oceanicola sp. D3 TaxID=2587163 RepID=UPI001123AE1A|nr:hypothetical protein [Oceanicola sp. D3]QDC09660.1 hypothetical protein FHY55_10575 [Oceanicola sp. D3]